MRFNRIAMLAAAALMLAGSLIAGHGAGAQAGEKLRIGVEGAYPPFSWKEPDGTLMGFDIDIATGPVRRDEPRVRAGRPRTGTASSRRSWPGSTTRSSPPCRSPKSARNASTSPRSTTTPRPSSWRPRARTSWRRRKDWPARWSVSSAARSTSATWRRCSPIPELKLYATQEDVFLDLGNGRIDAQISDSTQAMEGFLSQEAGKDFAFLGG